MCDTNSNIKHNLKISSAILSITYKLADLLENLYWKWNIILVSSFIKSGIPKLEFIFLIKQKEKILKFSQKVIKWLW